MNSGITGRSTMSSAMPDALNYHGWIGDCVSRWLAEGPLIEVGPGYGQYTRRFMGKAERVLAVDIDERCVADIRKLGRNVEAVVADIGAPAPSPVIKENSWASVVCLNVLEHIEDDVLALRNMGRWLAPRGRLVLLLPAHPALYGPMDEMAGHYRRYTRKDIVSKLLLVGLKCVRADYINPIGGLGWWVNAKTCSPKNLSASSVNGQIRLFDKLLVPLSRLATPLSKNIFGQSLLVIAEREGT